MTIWSWTSQKSLRRLKTKACWVLKKILKNEKKYLTLEFRIDRTSRLLIILFFTTLPNLIHHSCWLILENLASVPFYSRLKTFSFWFVKNAPKQMALKWFFMRINYCNWNRTHNHLVHKRTLNHLAKLNWFHACFRFRGCFEQGFPWHSDNYRVCIHSKNS